MPFLLRLPVAPLLGIALVATVSPRATSAEPEIVRAEDALEHVGERVTVCGLVVDTAYLPDLRGGPTFLNLERPYPDPVCSLVIWGQYRSAFRQSPHEFYRNKNICVTGVVTKYRTWPQFELRSPDAITVMDPGPDADRFTAEEQAVIRATLGALGYEAEDVGEWTADNDRALAAFQADRALPADADGWPQTLRALAEEASALTSEQSVAIVRLLLLHLAQRETTITGR